MKRFTFILTTFSLATFVFLASSARAEDQVLNADNLQIKMETQSSFWAALRGRVTRTSVVSDGVELGAKFDDADFATIDNAHGHMDLRPVYIRESLKNLWEAKVLGLPVQYNSTSLKSCEVFLQALDPAPDSGVNAQANYDLVVPASDVDIQFSSRYAWAHYLDSATLVLYGVPEKTVTFATFQNETDYGVLLNKKLGRLKAERKNVGIRYEGMNVGSLLAIEEVP